MLVTPFGLALGVAAGNDPQTPALVNFRPIKVDTAADYDTQTIAGMTPATGDLIVVLATRVIGTSPPDVTSVTWAGAAMTEIVEAKHSQTGGGHVWAGYIIGGTPELGDLVLTFADAEHRDLIGWLLAFDRLAVSPVGATFVYAARSDQSAQSIPLTVINAKSRLIGFAAAMLSTLEPMSASSGWTIRGTDKTGLGGSSDIAAAVADKAATATGLTTLTITADPTASPDFTDDWCACGIEVLPF